MTLTSILLKAKHIGIRNLKNNVSVVNLKKRLVICDRGVPVSVNLPYEDALELVDIFEELSDPQTIATIREGRSSIKTSAKGIPVSRLFKKLRKSE